jgi:putative hydrolase of the HAD superfamily
MIKAITFDLWNTVIKNKFYSDDRIQIFINVLDNIGKSFSYDLIKDAFQRVFYFHNINLEEIEYKHIYTEERLDKLLQFLDLDLNNEIRTLLVERFESVLLEDPPELREGVHDTLKILAEKYKLGLISNTGITPGSILSKALKKRSILKFFDTLSYSDEIGVYKPHKNIFKITLDNLKSKPEDSIHIGDILETDVKGAKEFGMKTIWIRNSNSENSGNVQPDYTIVEIPDILDILDKVRN